MGELSKIELEFPLNTSPKLLYSRVSTPSGLSAWFANDVTINGKIYTFIWERSEQQAELLQKKTNKSVRFRWLDNENSKAFFEFQVRRDELTRETALIVIDWVAEDEKDDTIGLWEKQISVLQRNLGL